MERNVFLQRPALLSKRLSDGCDDFWKDMNDSVKRRLSVPDQSVLVTRARFLTIHLGGVLAPGIFEPPPLSL
jgi:hypothetical protein